ncbi:MAG TPA: hypothetical protein PKD00_01960 [Burkholderiales bacterium]|nr:hypothetical protein [Burkholderiales bacterium]
MKNLNKKVIGTSKPKSDFLSNLFLGIIFFLSSVEDVEKAAELFEYSIWDGENGKFEKAELKIGMHVGASAADCLNYSGNKISVRRVRPSADNLSFSGAFLPVGKVVHKNPRLFTLSIHNFNKDEIKLFVEARQEHGIYPKLAYEMSPITIEAFRSAGVGSTFIVKDEEVKIDSVEKMSLVLRDVTRRENQITRFFVATGELVLPETKTKPITETQTAPKTDESKMSPLEELFAQLNETEAKLRETLANAETVETTKTTKTVTLTAAEKKAEKEAKEALKTITL